MAKNKKKKSTKKITVPVTTPKPEKELTVIEKLTIDLTIKQQEFRQAKANEQRLKSNLAKLNSELEKAQHDIIKIASAYTALNDFKVSLEPQKKGKSKK